MVGILAIINCYAFNVTSNFNRPIFYKMMNKPNEWEQSIIDNAVEYSIMEWRPLDKSTKTIVKSYDEAKDLYKKTSKKHKATLVYAINEAGRYANMNHLEDFKKRDN